MANELRATMISVGTPGSNLNPLIYVFRLSTLMGISPLSWSLNFSWPCMFYSLSPSIILGTFIYRLVFGYEQIYSKYKSSANASIMRNSYITLSCLEMAMYINIFVVSFMKAPEIKRFIEEFKAIESSLFESLIDIGYKRPLYKIKTFYFVISIFITRFIIVTRIFHDFHPLDSYKIFLEQYLLRAYIQDAQFVMFFDVLANHFDNIGLAASKTHSMSILKVLGKSHNKLCSLGDDISDYYSTHTLLSVLFNSISILSSSHTVIVELSNEDDSGIDIYLIGINVAVNVLTLYLVSSVSNEVQKKSQDYTFQLGNQLMMDFPRNQKILYSKEIFKMDKMEKLGQNINLKDYTNAILEMDRSVAVTACGFFEVNNTLIISIATGVLTYIVVLQQFITADVTPSSNSTALPVSPTVSTNVSTLMQLMTLTSIN